MSWIPVANNTTYAGPSRIICGIGGLVAPIRPSKNSSENVGFLVILLAGDLGMILLLIDSQKER